MTIFLILSALSVIFLVYVLVNFWREARRMNQGTRVMSELGYRGNPNVVAMTHPMSRFTEGGVAVLPRRAVASDAGAQNEQVSRIAKVLPMPAKPAAVRQNAGGAKFGVR